MSLCFALCFARVINCNFPLCVLQLKSTELPSPPGHEPQGPGSLWWVPFSMLGLPWHVLALEAVSSCMLYPF